MIEQELGNLLPFEVPFATLLTMVEVDPKDPGFQNPTKFVGPVYEKAAADQIAAQKSWNFKQDGARWRRVVAVVDKDACSELLAREWRPRATSPGRRADAQRSERSPTSRRSCAARRAP